MNNERIRALGKLEMLKTDLKSIAIRSGSYLATLREKTNTLLGDDFLTIDFKDASVLIGELCQMQSEAKKLISQIDAIKANFGIDDERE